MKEIESTGQYHLGQGVHLEKALLDSNDIQQQVIVIGTDINTNKL